MSSEARVFALSADANIYVVVDEKGNSLGTGTREVCEVLAQIASGKDAPNSTRYPVRTRITAGNVRSAITI